VQASLVFCIVAGFRWFSIQVAVDPREIDTLHSSYAVCSFIAVHNAPGLVDPKQNHLIQKVKGSPIRFVSVQWFLKWGPGASRDGVPKGSLQVCNSQSVQMVLVPVVRSQSYGGSLK
jgi:hypothetical protein